ncbi:Exocyst complex component 1 [Xenoophorus captivus]|uniref:Exocyst complex component 1 n=1 Tax=Xenoophorus captivus TaxID=1517983 RepID=A0ABV0QPA2_9TELE
MTAIKHALQRDIFTPNDERLLGIVNVCKAGKKKKNCFLCATVTTERPVQVKVVKVKKSDKGDFYKRQQTWELRDLTIVDAKDASKENPEFDLHFEKVYKWLASSTAEKNSFISCIWKLNQRYLRKKLEFVNVSSQLLEGGDEDTLEEYQELSTREEQDIESMMEMCEYAVSNAEAFAEKLFKELQVLDGANIQSIMASEKQVNILMQLLDEALAEVDTIEGKLSSYEEMLQSVKDQMDQISQSNRLIQISNTNNGKLLDDIQFLVGHDQSSTLSQNSAELTLPKHSPLHRDLLRYAKLMEWLKNTQREKYEGLSRVRHIISLNYDHIAICFYPPHTTPSLAYAVPETEEADGSIQSKIPPQADHRHSLSSDSIIFKWKDMVPPKTC